MLLSSSFYICLYIYLPTSSPRLRISRFSERFRDFRSRFAIFSSILTPPRPNHPADLIYTLILCACVRVYFFEGFTFSPSFSTRFRANLKAIPTLSFPPNRAHRFRTLINNLKSETLHFCVKLRAAFCIANKSSPLSDGSERVRTCGHAASPSLPPPNFPPPRQLTERDPHLQPKP